MAMGIVYVGVGLFGALGARFVKPLTEAYGFHTALMVLGLLMFLRGRWLSLLFATGRLKWDCFPTAQPSPRPI